MATTTTFKGAPKPPKSGWYYESNRHALASKGIKSGNFQPSIIAPVQPHLKSSSGFQKILARIPTEERRKLFVKQFNSLTKKEQELVVTLLKDTDGDKAIDLFDCNPYNPQEQDLKEFIAKASEKAKEGASWVGEKVKEGYEKAMQKPQAEEVSIEHLEPEVEVSETEPSAEYKTEGEMEKPEEAIEGESEPEVESTEETYEEPKQSVGERIQKASREYQEAYKQRKAQKLARLEGVEPEPYQEPTTTSGRLGEILANLDADYSSEDLANLNDKEIELLAVRYDSQYPEGAMMEPQNPFVDELKKRMVAHNKLANIKRKIEKEIHEKPKPEPGLFQEIFGD